MTKKPIFNNKLNNSYFISPLLNKICTFFIKLFRLKVKQIWETRSPAVVAVILAIFNDQIYVLSEKRSKIMPDAPEKWVVPGGYIDWNETGWDALRREVFEETSFFIDDYEKYLLTDNEKQPFFVTTDMLENRQNIVLNYCLIYKFKDVFPIEVESFRYEEVDIIKWIPIETILDSEYNWAFKHDIRIMQAISKFENYFK